MSATDRHRSQLEQQIGPLVQTLGYELDEVAVTRVGRRSLVRVTVDAEDGVDLDAISDISRVVSAELDANDPFGTPFVLEVSSPGIDRPLTLPRHWRRNIGRLIRTEVADTAVTGRINAVDDDGVVLILDGGEQTTVGWTDLGAGRIQIEFARRGPGEPAPTDKKG